MRILTIYILSLLFFCSCDLMYTENSPDETKYAYNSEYQLIWQDEFDYTGLPDSTKWDYDTEGNEAGWGNSEAQHYTVANKKNAYADNGILRITAHKESIHGKEFTSARMVSRSYWQYGIIEVKAKLPAARGTWSAIWMMPQNWSFNDGNWPDIGEIDIMEHVGHDPGVIHASAHSKDYQWQKGTQKTATIRVNNATEEFNIYKLEWTPSLLTAYVNDSLYFQYNNEGLGDSKWPYNKPFYLILNLAVGGAWGNVKGVDTTAFPQTLEVDYVRVFQKQPAN